ncbi:Small ribosomal subunit biogenesis [Umbelopsis sp. WA50703]
MVLQVSNANNVKIYTVSGGLGSRSIPDWLARKKKKALKKDLEYRARIELIQDFEFPEASNRIKCTADGNFAMATGVYKPQIRVYEFAEMSMKFERHTDAENVNFEVLSDDWTKSVHLQSDRSIEFHSQGGIHYRTRIPKFGRDMAYHYPSCDLLVGAAGNEVYRLNLEQGRFLNPIATDSESGVNATELCPAHQLFGFGTASGTVEFWDPRSRSRVGLLQPQVPAAFGSTDATSLEVSALKFRHDGLSLAVGTNTGHTLLYDLRSSMPWLVKDHQYGFPIKSLNWHDGITASSSEGSGKVIVSDCKIVKIWDRLNGSHFTSIEPENDINDVATVSNSGLLFMAMEGIQMGAYYIPQLGPAPKWASFLDNLTEEMEENPSSNIYDDYKFVSRKELDALGLEHLVGTDTLKAYMHGFFVDLRLYEKAKLIANPFAYDDYRERLVREKLEKERASRIRATNKLPAVNKELAKKLLDEGKKKKKKEEKPNPLEDDRFKDLFADPDFQVDEESNEYKLLHPTAKKNLKVASEDEDMSEADEEPEEGSDVDSDDSRRMSGDSDSDDDIISKIRKERGGHVRSKAAAQTTIRSQPHERWKPKEKTKAGKRELEMRTGTTNNTGRAVGTSRKDMRKSFGDRVASASQSSQGHRVSRTAMGGMEMSFKLQSKKKRDDSKTGAGGPERRQRRSASKNTFRGM